MGVSMLVCVPGLEGVMKLKTSEALGNAIEYLTAECGDDIKAIRHSYPVGYSIARARNFMAQWALEAKADYLLMVDSDVVLPHKAIANLLEHRKMVCLGWYPRGTDGRQTGVVRLNTPGHGDCYSVDELAGMDSEPFEVKAGGMGCALISTEVFGRFRRPWFEYLDTANGTGTSEDYMFCKKCWESGVSVFLDPRVGCGHIKDRLLEAR